MFKIKVLDNCADRHSYVIARPPRPTKLRLAILVRFVANGGGWEEGVRCVVRVALHWAFGKALVEFDRAMEEQASGQPLTLSSLSSGCRT